jgi:hypothetical protein
MSICSQCGVEGHNKRTCTGAAAAAKGRVCGQCGQPGHNKRTCPGGEPAEVVEPPVCAPSKGKKQKRKKSELPAQAAEPVEAPKPVSKKPLDRDTQEAIDWYLGTRYPWLEEERRRRTAAPKDDEEEEEAE